MSKIGQSRCCRFLRMPAERPAAGRIRLRHGGRLPSAMHGEGVGRCVWYSRRRAVAARGRAGGTPAPSLMNSTRPAWLAALMECVTIRMVWPSCVDFAKQAQQAVCGTAESSAPVGSSARMSWGLVMRARATAARCFWPPRDLVGEFGSRMPPMPSFWAMAAEAVFPFHA